jgi:hypothetical protein
MVLKLNADMTKYDFQNYQEEEFRDILMCMATAGADVYASDRDEHTVSQVACMSRRALSLPCSLLFDKVCRQG